jgi:hypothetical protein
MLPRKALLTLLALITLVLGAACATSPPVQEMSDARQAIAAAEEAQAERYAPDQLSEARRYLADAEENIRLESFNLARINAVRALNRATQALEAAQSAAVGAGSP